MIKKDNDLAKKRAVIGRRLYKIRKSHHMSMREVALHSRISKTQVSRLEHGIYLPRLSTLYSLAKCYKINSNAFLRELGLEPRTATAEYRQIPVYQSTNVKPELDMNFATHYIPYTSGHCPKHCFFVRMLNDEDGIKPYVKKNSLVLVDTYYKYISGDVYAVYLNGKIKVGRIYKSHKFRVDDDKHRTGVLVINRDSYFSTDYPRSDWKVLGRATKYIDDF